MKPDDTGIMSLLIEPSLAQTARPTSADIPVAEPASPLLESHFQQIQLAHLQRRPILKAAKRARGSAITILVIAAGSVPFVLISPGWLDLLIVAGLGVIGAREYIGAQQMRQGLPTAAKYLGYNQLIFIALICVYCVLQMLSFSNDQTRGTLISPEVQSQLAMLPGLEHDINSQIDFWAPLVNYGFYSLVIVISAIVQGSMSYYYFTRQRYLDALTQNTPAWIQRLFAELNV